MLKRLVSLLITLHLSLALTAQSKTDSLEQKLRSASGRDKLSLLAKLIQANRRPDPQKAETYFLAFEKSWQEQGEPDEFKGSYFHTKGEMEMRAGNYEAAVSALNTAIESSLKQRDYDMLWANYNSLGTAWQEQGNLHHTLEAFLKAYQVAEQHLEEGSRAGSAINLGVVYAEQGQWSEALKYFRYSLNYHARFGQSWGLGNCLNNVGQVHMFMGNRDSALHYFRAALRVWNQISDDYGLAMTSFNIGSLEYKASQYEEAETMYLKSLTISEQLNDQYGITQNLTALSSLYFDWNREAQGLAYLDSAIAFAKRSNILAAVRDSYKIRYQHFKKKQDAARALEAHELYFFWYDSLNSSTRTKNLQELQSKFESEKKEKEIIMQKAEIDKQATVRSFLLGGMALILLFLFYVFRSFRQKQKANVIITRQKQEVEVQKALLEVKQKEILDSIHYARRIQHSLLPNERVLDRLLKRLQNNSRKAR